MDWTQPWFLIAVVGVLGVYLLNLTATLLDLRQFALGIPDELRDRLDEPTFRRTRDYAAASAHQDVVSDTVSLMALLVFWWMGGFGWLDETVRSWTSSPLLHGTGVIAFFLALQSLLSLPFDIWHTFGLEARFGFNRTTWQTFVADRLKSLCLGCLVGLPLLALIVGFFLAFQYAALWSWLALAAFSITMSWLSPRLIMPLFLKFQPLEEGTLRTAILDLAKRLDFPVGDVSIVDGSRRSTKANAFFAGFGATRRIALFDTLLKDHDQPGILGILAHEIGHGKLRHVPKHLAVSLLESGLTLALLAWVLRSESAFHAFGLGEPSVGIGILVFSILFKPLSLILGIASMAMSRKHEFEEDAYAARATGDPAALRHALSRLATGHLAHPRPHPLGIWLHHSHPPVVERLRALSSHVSQPTPIGGAS